MAEKDFHFILFNSRNLAHTKPAIKDIAHRSWSGILHHPSLAYLLNRCAYS